MALIASGVKLLDPLKKPLGAINQSGQQSLQDALGSLQGRENTSANASGRVQGQYIPQAITQAGTSAGNKIQDTLGGILGNGSYKDLLSEQDYQRNLQIAKAIADANKPGLLQEVLGGLGGAAGLAGSGVGLYGALNKNSHPGGSSPLSYGNYSGVDPNLMSLYDPYAYDPLMSYGGR